ncbi:MAG: VWA domain-containing protein [Pyrinomonadaceae bacterium]
MAAAIFIALPLYARAQEEQQSSSPQSKPAPDINLNSPSPSPTPPPSADETIRVYTEEVRIPVFAYDEYGNFDYAVEADDLLVLEDGVPQKVRSVRHLPANVLLLLDTGGESAGLGGLSKSTSLTRAVALRVLAGLHRDDRVAVMQFADRPELLQGWTTDRQAAERALRWKLLSGKRVRLAEAIMAAAHSFADTPEGSRHVVLVTDGVETPGGKTDRTEALKQLLATRATIHIISYTQLVRQKQRDKVEEEINNTAIRQRSSVSVIANAGINPNPASPAGANPPPVMGGNNITFDPAMRRLRKAYEADVRRSEQWLTSIAEETGTRIRLPVSAAEMLDGGAKVARDIGAQYVVTYTPKRPFVSAQVGEYRRLEVAPRRTGLNLRTRRGYVTTAPTSTVTATPPQSQ